MKKNNNKNKIKNRNIKNLPFSPLVVMMPLIIGLFIPLIVHMDIISIENDFREMTASVKGIAPDVFLHSKEQALFLTAGLAMFFMLCYKLLNRRIVFANKFMIGGLVYIAFSLISAVFAKNPKVAFIGGEDLFHGFFVILCYGILFYYGYMIICADYENRDKYYTYILRSTLILALILSTIGILQWVGIDPFKWDVIQSICNLKNAKITDEGRIYTTLYNSNYVGVMIVLLLPVLFGGIIVEKQKWVKSIYVITSIFVIGGIAACGSKAALVVMLFLIIINTMLLIKRKVNIRYVFIGCGIILIFIATVFLLKDKFRWENVNSKSNYSLTKLETKDDCIIMSINNEEVTVTWNDADITFIDSKGKNVKTGNLSEKEKTKIINRVSKGMITINDADDFNPKKIDDSRFDKVIFFKSAIKAEEKNIEGYIFFIDKQLFYFSKDRKEKGYEYLSPLGVFVKAVDSKDAFDKKIYGFASNRGYIWSKTLPILMSDLIIGEGMDHFVLAFPNNDYAAKSNIKKINTIYNKPHNWYLQIWSESGLIALIGMIFMITFLLIGGIINKSVLFENDRLSNMVIQGLFASIIGYILMGFVNDSMIVTAPVFWIYFGLFAGGCYCNKNQINQ
ncbi:MAG: hypothetical protein E7254_04315 [Lachnospiraceae bacterium]|nr:hypothetical protein [Lachnospiraceae bacterium]